MCKSWGASITRATIRVCCESLDLRRRCRLSVEPAFYCKHFYLQLCLVLFVALTFQDSFIFPLDEGAFGEVCQLFQLAYRARTA